MNIAYITDVDTCSLGSLSKKLNKDNDQSLELVVNHNV